LKTYALEIDHERCWGCKTCEVACKQENRAPEGVQLIYVSEQDPGDLYKRPDFVFNVNRCLHCEEPDCLPACPVEAITLREDGIVVLDPEECNGCELCIEACPYDAVAFDRERGVALKCNLCHHRVDAGLIPACADNVCLAHCIHFEYN
jgi:Fe-S-cluster-containing dehydrogenase component